MALRRALILAAGVAVLSPATAAAKVVCEERAATPGDLPLQGLPERPVAGRTYELTVDLPSRGAVNPAPYLGFEYCGEGAPEPDAPGGWFARADSGWSIDVTFPRAGPWKASFMDLSGTFHDVPIGPVRPGAMWKVDFTGWWRPRVGRRARR